MTLAGLNLIWCPQVDRQDGVADGKRTSSRGERDVFKLLQGCPFGQQSEAHYVLALRGATFPGCLRCSDRAKFQLALSAVYVVTHPFFHSGQRVTIGEEYSS
jgi:hypothetical protein